jgi:hypothetical protein
MRRYLTAGATALFLCATGTAAHCQTQDPNAEVLQVVTRLFDGMRAKDTTVMRSTFAPNARLVSVTMRSGAPATLSETAIDSWIASVSRSENALDEKIFSPEVRVDGSLATVWTRYELWVNNALRSCGYDAFQLARTSAGWKIIHIADSRRTEGCGR